MYGEACFVFLSQSASQSGGYFTLAPPSSNNHLRSLLGVNKGIYNLTLAVSYLENILLLFKTGLSPCFTFQ